ncbi:MAG TPA: lysylphosphatidylglycerol synthase transmembrane domain-containing protein [Actinomycetota bacterium]|nr:lysylphosphatidylglycerol synthase transmembrane domain-containing protein [Actinomycetota bacterium]
MRRFIRIAVPVLLVGGIFFFAFPKMADFSQVWLHVKAMTWLELTTLLLVALWNLGTYWFVMMAALPGSNVWQTMKVNQASTAVSNTLPGGGAIGVGVMYSMFTGYGFSPGAITLSILVSGIWNNFVKLGMPVVALALLAVTGSVGSGLLLASVAGVAGLAVAVGTFGAVLRSERLARRVGVRLGKIVDAARRMARKEPGKDLGEATVRFRRDAIGLIRKRWLRLTVTSLVSHLSLFLVLLLALRHVAVAENEVSWVEALAAFAFVRLISALPITPGGLGVVELGLSAALVAAGGDEAGVVAAVLVFRALTYLLPVPLGLVLYVKWRGGSETRRRRLEAAAAAPTPP